MSDVSLQKAVEVELDWEPRVDATKLGVSATGGAVTLTGDVATYAEKTAAVTAAERVYGVTSVADQITVEIPGVAPDDTQIAQAADAPGVVSVDNQLSVVP